MAKLTKSTLPSGHTKADFKCFGPVATKDGEFSGTKLADLGCFKQGEIDSNKYYHAAVVQSKKDSKWYAYFEFGRTGSSTNPQFQFIECGGEASAQSEYEKQCHKKNDKRGEWVNHPTLGRMLQPKADDDCYLVRPQVTRLYGLPDAANIGGTSTTQVVVKSSGTAVKLDKSVQKLINDLNIGTTEFTRASMVGSALPTLGAITEARDILNEATKINNKLKIEADILNSTELSGLTQLLYSRIPKKKNRNDEKSTWWLTATNIYNWIQDLDAFEAAVASIKRNMTL